MAESLGEFLGELERAGELVRVRAAVSRDLEITEIVDRESKSAAPGLPSAAARRNDPRFHHLGGRALLFERVRGCDMPVAINVLGSYRRMEMALSCHTPDAMTPPARTPGGFDAIGERIGALVKPEPPTSLRSAVEAAKRLAPLLRIPPRRARRAPCQEVVLTGRDIDLDRLPLLKCWPRDGDLGALGYPANINDTIDGVRADDARRGRYITFGHVHTIHAEDAGKARPASHNVGMYRVQQMGPRRLAMHWHLHHDGARHWRSWKARGERMPVAIALGGEPALPFAAIAPLPPGISELLLAGFLNGRGIPMARCRTVPLRVPANAEIVIEGFVSDRAGGPGFDPRADPREKLGEGAVFEGPFGDHTGFYSLPDRYPVVEVTAVTMRRDAVFPATVVGLPPQEDYYMGKAVERLFLPLLKTLIHDIEDYDLPMFGAFHNCAFLRIRKEYAMQARRVMHAVWGAGQMAWTKNIFVVDETVDVHDAAAVLRAAAERADPESRVERVFGPVDILDHAAPALGAAAKVGFDATARWEGEGIARVASAGAEQKSEKSEGSRAPACLSEEEAAALVEVVRGMEGVRDAACPAELGRGWLFVSIEKSGAHQGRRLCKRLLAMQGPAAPPYTVVLGARVDVARFDEAMFHWCANCDAERDGLRVGGRAAFDATPKVAEEGTADRPVRQWPPLIEMDEETRALVTERWEEYGLGR